MPKSKDRIDFNLPFMTGKEADYVVAAAQSDHLSGNGHFTGACHQFFQNRYGFRKALLTSSCTDALEMCALLCDIQPGDEVIVPSFSFVSCANAFVLRGAHIVFADSEPGSPNIDASSIDDLITPRTKALVLIHYAGIACDMQAVMSAALKHRLLVIEDAAHAIDSYYNGQPLGGIGDLGTFSFHETKNVICGEGGLLAVNNRNFEERAEIIWEKGTNRAAFSRGEVRKYEWVDIGSSFLPSELSAAFLLAQLEAIDQIQSHRKRLWHHYSDNLAAASAGGHFSLPSVPGYATTNGHMFYLTCPDRPTRDALIRFMASNKIDCTFHYLPLHLSPYFRSRHDGRPLTNAIRFSDCLVRLPLHYQLTLEQVEFVSEKVRAFFKC